MQYTTDLKDYNPGPVKRHLVSKEIPKRGRCHRTISVPGQTTPEPNARSVPVFLVTDDADFLAGD